MTHSIIFNSIVIIDFGSQYTQLIARRLREAGFYCELYPFDVDPHVIAEAKPKGIILSGGPETVTEANAPQIPQVVFDLGCPLFGICYGMQAMAVQLGGKVAAAKTREFGSAQVRTHGNTRLLANIYDHKDQAGGSSLEVWMSHGDHVEELPAGFEAIASTDSLQFAGMADESRGYYAVQFHPEVTHTLQGKTILSRFVNDICQCEQSWNINAILENRILTIREKVGNDVVLLGLSGGVDSAVVAALLQRAIGKQLICMFVDNGLLRTEETENSLKILEHQLDINLVRIDAQQRFLTALKGVSDPEQKRKIVGEKFVQIFEEKAIQLPNVRWLAQGTIYSDVIESARTRSGKEHIIKSHHNVGGLPAKMRLKLLEPLRELFKDEVAKLGAELNLPAEMMNRHPFPGPGFSVRILGEVTEEAIYKLRQADSIFLEELHKHDWYHRVSQAFAVFLPVKSVGVVGDARQYEPVIALRAVETVDFMTAQWAHLPYELLAKVSERIVNEVKGISRVVYDISGKPPATIEWE